MSDEMLADKIITEGAEGTVTRKALTQQVKNVKEEYEAKLIEVQRQYEAKAKELELLDKTYKNDIEKWQKQHQELETKYNTTVSDYAWTNVLAPMQLDTDTVELVKFQYSRRGEGKPIDEWFKSHIEEKPAYLTSYIKEDKPNLNTNKNVVPNTQRRGPTDYSKMTSREQVIQKLKEEKARS